jgi:hypothetical protein
VPSLETALAARTLLAALVFACKGSVNDVTGSVEGELRSARCRLRTNVKPVTRAIADKSEPFEGDVRFRHVMQPVRVLVLGVRLGPATLDGDRSGEVDVGGGGGSGSWCELLLLEGPAKPLAVSSVIYCGGWMSTSWSAA